MLKYIDFDRIALVFLEGNHRVVQPNMESSIDISCFGGDKFYLEYVFNKSDNVHCFNRDSLLEYLSNYLSLEEYIWLETTIDDYISSGKNPCLVDN